MRRFYIPFDIHSEDKIIGGYLSLRQLAWLAAGIGMAVFLFMIDLSYLSYDEYGAATVKSFNLAIRIIISIVAIGFGIFFAFFEVAELKADSYVFKKLLFMRKRKVIKYTHRK